LIRNRHNRKDVENNQGAKMGAGGLTVRGGGHDHGGHDHGGHGQGGHQGDHGFGGQGRWGWVDVPPKFRPEVMRWLRTYLDGLSDSLHGGHDRFPNGGDSGYGPHDGRDPFGTGSHQGYGRDSVGAGDHRGDSHGNFPVWHEDATVPAADTSSASGHFGHGAGGPSFVNRSHDAATVFSGHHSDGVGAATAFGAGGGYFGGVGAVTLQGTGNGAYLEVTSAGGTNLLVAGSTTGGNTFEPGLPAADGHGGPIAGAVVSTGGSGLQAFLLGSSSTLTGSNAAGAANLYEFIRDSATESNGGAHYAITDFNAANSTLFMTDSTTAAASVHVDGIAKAIGGGAEITLSDGSTITLKGIDPHSLVAHSGGNGSISIT
jgi:hypothetical protein